MKRSVQVGIALIVLIAAGYAVLGRARGPGAASQAPVIPPVKAGGRIIAEARILPVHGILLSFASGGTVAEILVKEGDQVKSGQVLARLEETKQAAAGVAQAEAALRRTQARLALLRAGARDQERTQAHVAVAEAQKRAEAAQQHVVQAEAALRLAEDDLQRAEHLLAEGALSTQATQQARSRVTSARADLDAARADAAAVQAQVISSQQQMSLVDSGARPEDLEAAQADVAAAAAALKQAQITLDQTELRTTLAGTVAWIGPKVGEFVPPGTPAVRVGDLSTWQAETTDLTELNVVSLQVGSVGTVTLDGIPGLEMNGRVIDIRPFGENRQGDIVYRVTVALDHPDPRLRWNMTASVAFEHR